MEPRNLLDLAVHKRSIIAPGSTKQLVAFDTDREALRDVFVVDQAVAKIENTCPSAARDDLLKWIERVKRTRRRADFRIGGAAERRCSGKGRSWRDVARKGTRRLEIAGGLWRKFIVCFGIHVIEVAKNPELIIADFMLESRITAPAFLLGI